MVDRYFSLEGVTIINGKLVGLCAMLIACKYEEVRSPQVDEFIHLALNYNRYTREDILAMENLILDQLGWYLTVPTNYMFLVRYVKVAKADQHLEHMIYFFAELGLMQYDRGQVLPLHVGGLSCLHSSLYSRKVPSLDRCPSASHLLLRVTAPRMCTRTCTLGKFPLWTDALQHHTSFSESQLIECAPKLLKPHCSAPCNESNVVYRKYMHKEFGGIACYYWN